MVEPLSLREMVLSQSKGGLVRKIKLETLADGIVDEMPYLDQLWEAMQTFRVDLEDTDIEDINEQFIECFGGLIGDYKEKIDLLMEYQAEMLSPEELREHAVAYVIGEISHFSDEHLDYLLKNAPTVEYSNLDW